MLMFIERSKKGGGRKIVVKQKDKVLLNTVTLFTIFYAGIIIDNYGEIIV